MASEVSESNAPVGGIPGLLLKGAAAAAVSGVLVIVFFWRDVLEMLEKVLERH